MSSCRKRRYRDKIAAMIALDRIRRNSDEETLPQRAYRCHLCKGWHLTSQPFMPREGPGQPGKNSPQDAGLVGRHAPSCGQSPPPSPSASVLGLAVYDQKEQQ